ncbi:hypothetical protein CVT24_000114 [Panaeolus cyanescens]|uniref:Cytochrome P450 n=1 Tax=Panaeolus cyanescens TaxID=181874 RepID=A0A409W7L5_9AGAR|nr:hypothetical protein CVT24_000114 [Panaeolus cyanescens]
MSYSLPITVLAAVVTAYVLLSRGFGKSSKGLRYPPGPKPRFITGNAKDIPHERHWIGFANWTKKYGSGFIYFTVFRTKFLVINDYKVAFDLLDKRSTIYSDRPKSVMIDLIGWGFNMTFFNYGERWKEHRRVMHQNLNNRAVREWRQLQSDVTHKFLKKLVANPNDWLYRIEQYALPLPFSPFEGSLPDHSMTGSAIMKFTYGYELKEKDEYMPTVKKAITALTTSQGIGFMVDKIPLLQYVPAWVPGTQFKKFAKDYRPYCEAILEGPFKDTKERWAAGTAPDSYVTRLLEGFGGAKISQEKEEVVKDSSAVLYAAGTDSTYSILSSFFLACTIHPEAHKKARDEIDRVVGTDRLPDFGDRESLPYVEALVKELYRWNPAAPLGPSHQILVDDEYEGYFIPAGTIIHPNIWAMTHNEEMYPDSLTFNPDRFLGLDEVTAKEIDPKNFIFGFGRRVCVGQYFADQQIWLAVACLVATFDIRKAKDQSGKEITPVPNYPSFVGKPDPFPCVVTLRNTNAAKLIDELPVEA